MLLLSKHYFCSWNYPPLSEPPEQAKQQRLQPLPLNPLSCLETPRCLTPVEHTHWRVQVSIYPWYVFVFVGGGARMERKPPVGIQTQRNMYLPSQYTSTGTLMTRALVYIWLLDSRVQYPTVDNIVFPSGWWCITKIRNDVPDVSRGKNNKSHRLVT